MPSERDQLIEKLAWRSLDRFCMDNPKPRLSPRTKHRCKLWLRERVSGNIDLDGPNMDTIYFPIDEHSKIAMLDYARRTLDD